MWVLECLYVHMCMYTALSVSVTGLYGSGRAYNVCFLAQRKRWEEDNTSYAAALSCGIYKEKHLLLSQWTLLQFKKAGLGDMFPKEAFELQAPEATSGSLFTPAVELRGGGGHFQPCPGVGSSISNTSMVGNSLETRP